MDFVIREEKRVDYRCVSNPDDLQVKKTLYKTCITRKFSTGIVIESKVYEKPRHSEGTFLRLVRFGQSNTPLGLEYTPRTGPRFIHFLLWRVLRSGAGKVRRTYSRVHRILSS